MSCKSSKSKKRGRDSPGKTHGGVNKRVQFNMENEAVGNMSLSQLMDSFGGMLDRKLALVATKEDVLELTGKVVELEKENRVLRSEIQLMKSKMDDLEGRSRRNNLIFKGIQNIGNKNCEEGIKTFCLEVLGIETDLFINRAHLLGKSKSTVIAHFPRDKDISTIFSNVHKLKGSKFVIHRDVTKMTRVKIAKMLELKREILKIVGKVNVKLVHDSLIVEDVKFLWTDGMRFVTADGEEGVSALKTLLRYDFASIVGRLASFDRKAEDYEGRTGSRNAAEGGR
jgi:hypothetical protein